MAIKPWTVLHQREIHQTDWIKILEDECEVDGQVVCYTYTRRRDQGPMIIAQENDGKLWLVRQYRHPIKKILWQFPAEGKHRDESYADAAQRGIEEELGKHAKQLHKLGDLYPDPGGLDQLAEVYLAQDLTDIQHDPRHHHEQEVEQLEIKAFSLVEIDQMIQQGEICDGWTLAGLYLYKSFVK